MYIAKVTGHVVSTKKDDRMIGFKLLTICPLQNVGVYSDTVRVAIDGVGAGIGEEVLVVDGFAARQAVGKQEAPIDSAIVGIIDTMDIGDAANG
ncbi:EutN/CcmL family microcompartment protein [Caproiciproducens sp.]